MTRPTPGPIRREPNDFWRFSLHTYRQPGVEAACLALQDRCGTDTNLLLYCCWIGSTGRSLDKRALRRALAVVARWQADVILPLRRARNSLKRSPQGLPEGWAGELRKRIAATELDMEFAEQRALFELAQALPPAARPSTPRATALAGIARYLGLLGTVATPAVARRVGIVIDACWPSDAS
jgi:uncharacterized protein (TIGR02444 family)